MFDDRRHTAPRLTRRRIIKNALRVGSVGYAAPLILSSTAWAGPAVVSIIACGNPGCERGSCGIGGCACVITTSGPACVEPQCFANLHCMSVGDCPAGYLCATVCCQSTLGGVPTTAGPTFHCMPACGTPYVPPAELP